MAYIFEWDPAKAAANLRKHGVSFDEATTVFADPLSMLRFDPDHARSEDRFLVLGRSRQDRLIIVSFAERGNRTRLISARLVSRSERHNYEEDSV
ncbi:MAG: BrnT family toxin [Gemmatimonadales bacterium]